MYRRNEGRNRMTFEEEIPFYVDWRNEPECKHSFQLTVNTNCPSVEIYMEQHDKAIRAELLNKIMQKQRTIVDDDGVVYRVVFIKDIEAMKGETE